ncbi:MAG: class I SAM-dependent methyltransferase [Actinomycetota bacterium]|nr:class I SAM-dependent methyltransferase [Actinomycetota bacterium]
MNWLLKAAAQKALSAVPAAERANYVFQRRVTRSLPVGTAGAKRKFARALAHFAAFRSHVPQVPSERAVFYEFGAGWDLLVQLSYVSLGVGRQIVVDIRPNVRLELVNESLATFAAIRPELEREAGQELRDLGPANLDSLQELESRFGIVYRAPADARATGLPAGCVDFVSSTNTLEHVPRDDIALLLAECVRLLRPEGVMSFRIDLQDHSSYGDQSVSAYNFLRFSERRWRLVSSKLSYQNRLRYPDYVDLFREAGLEIVAESLARPSDDELQALERLELAPEFRAYSLDDLAIRSLEVVVRPALPHGAQEPEDVARRRGPRVRPGASA